MTGFVVVYRGPTIAQARLGAVSADPTLIAAVAARLLEKPALTAQVPPDPAAAKLDGGRRQALSLIRREVEADHAPTN
ncbi:MAG: hypothetical protein CL878_15420 [Dehalococcoidia bacterium]|nr:hypothetical protein [Dehalococcoidia bacterium]